MLRNFLDRVLKRNRASLGSTDFSNQMRGKAFGGVYRAPVDSLYETLGARRMLLHDSRTIQPCHAAAPVRATGRHSSKSSSPPADPRNAVQPTGRFAHCERLLSEAAWASAGDRQTSMQKYATRRSPRRAASSARQRDGLPG